MVHVVKGLHNLYVYPFERVLINWNQFFAYYL